MSSDVANLLGATILNSMVIVLVYNQVMRVEGGEKKFYEWKMALLDNDNFAKESIVIILMNSCSGTSHHYCRYRQPFPHRVTRQILFTWETFSYTP